MQAEIIGMTIVRTLNTVYTILSDENNRMTIHGHPAYCPTPTPITHFKAYKGECMWVNFRDKDGKIQTMQTSEIKDITFC